MMFGGFRRSKFGAKKAYADGITFPSTLEKNCYLVLKQSGLQFVKQVPFELLPKARVCGKSLMKTEYICDFIVSHNGKEYVIDAKGMRTPVYDLKAKLMVHKHEIFVIECKSAKQMTEIVKAIKEGLSPMEVHELCKKNRKTKKAK